LQHGRDLLAGGGRPLGGSLPRGRGAGASGRAAVRPGRLALLECPRVPRRRRPAAPREKPGRPLPGQLLGPAQRRARLHVRAGDGPGDVADIDTYRCYSPSGPLDGTAHLTATVASVAHDPAAVLENLHEAQRDAGLPARGRYGFSNLNVDRNWVGRDMVGIDA